MWPTEIKLWSVLAPKPACALLCPILCWVLGQAQLVWALGLLCHQLWDPVQVASFLGLIISCLPLHKRSQSTHSILILIMPWQQSRWLIHMQAVSPYIVYSCSTWLVSLPLSASPRKDIRDVTAGHPWDLFSGTRHPREARRELKFHPFLLGETKILLTVSLHEIVCFV